MTDESYVAAPEDISRVNVCLRSDLVYWTRVLKTDEPALRRAVMRVGEGSWLVRAEIRRGFER